MKTTRLFSRGLAAGLLLFGALRLAAGHDEEEGDPRFRQMDTDHDGRLSRTEHAIGANAVFAEMDADHDSVVTIAELETHLAQRKEAAVRFSVTPARADADRSLGSGASRADGSVSSHEVANARTAAPAELSAAEKIRLSDGNGDGRLTAAEYAAGAGTLFSRLDADRDGYLSRIECQGGVTLAAHR